MLADNEQCETNTPTDTCHCRLINRINIHRNFILLFLFKSKHQMNEGWFRGRTSFLYCACVARVNMWERVKTYCLLCCWNILWFYVVAVLICSFFFYRKMKNNLCRTICLSLESYFIEFWYEILFHSVCQCVALIYFHWAHV